MGFLATIYPSINQENKKEESIFVQDALRNTRKN